MTLKRVLWFLFAVAVAMPVVFSLMALASPVHVVTRSDLQSATDSVDKAWSGAHSAWFGEQVVKSWETIDGLIGHLTDTGAAIVAIDKVLVEAKSATATASMLETKAVERPVGDLRRSIFDSNGHNRAELVEDSIQNLRANQERALAESAQSMSLAAAELSKLAKNAPADGATLTHWRARMGDVFQPLVKSLFPWPFVIAALGVYALSSGGYSALSRLVNRLQSVTLGSLAVSFGGGQKRGNVQGAIDSFKDLARDAYERAVHDNKVSAKFDTVMGEITGWLEDVAGGRENAEKRFGKLRFTLHVPFRFVDDALYQLLDYRTALGKETLAGTSGRLLSQRFGIVGLAFRTEKNQLEGSIPTDEATLIERWSMTKAEARQRSSRQSMAAIPLSYRDKQLMGVVFFDAKEKDGIPSAEQGRALADVITKAAKSAGLVDALIAVQQSVADAGVPDLRILG